MLTHGYIRESFAVIAGYQPAELKGLPLRDRFEFIPWTLNYIKSLNNNAKTPYSVLEDLDPNFRRSMEITLESMTLGIQHTSHYEELLDDIRDLTVLQLKEDNMFMHGLKNWGSLTEQKKMFMASILHRTQIKQAERVLGLPMVESEIDILEDEDIEGCFLGDICKPLNSKEILINEECFDFDQPFDLLSTVYHETVHDIGFQLGHIAARIFKNFPQKKLLFDAAISALTYKHQAMIPSDIWEAYLAQGHEKVAHSQHRKFETDLQRLLGVLPNCKAGHSDNGPHGLAAV